MTAAQQRQKLRYLQLLAVDEQLSGQQNQAVEWEELHLWEFAEPQREMREQWHFGQVIEQTVQLGGGALACWQSSFQPKCQQVASFSWLPWLQQHLVPF